MKNKEIWKAINGYENYYEISNYGKIKSLKRVVVNCWNEKQLLEEKILN